MRWGINLKNAQTHFLASVWTTVIPRGNLKHYLYKLLGGKHRFIMGNEKVVNACEIFVQARRLKVYH